jgi:hypothetical protein
MTRLKITMRHNLDTLSAKHAAAVGVGRDLGGHAASNMLRASAMDDIRAADSTALGWIPSAPIHQPLSLQ